MKKIISVALASFLAAAVSAQQGAPAASSSPAPTVSNAAAATAADVDALRQQVQSLTETVKALQQQVKDQQAALEKANLTGESGLPENPEPSPIAGAEGSPAPAGSAPPRFPTEDTSVVSSTAAAAASPGSAITAASEAFPTTDTSVITPTGEAPPIARAGPSLTAPITIGGGKAYMNISLDSLFVLAYSSAADLNNIEVGDHDPQHGAGV
jgi:TolA-binding protein